MLGKALGTACVDRRRRAHARRRRRALPDVCDGDPLKMPLKTRRVMPCFPTASRCMRLAAAYGKTLSGAHVVQTLVIAERLRSRDGTASESPEEIVTGERLPQPFAR